MMVVVGSKNGTSLFFFFKDDWNGNSKIHSAVIFNQSFVAAKSLLCRRFDSYIFYSNNRVCESVANTPAV